MADRCDAFTLVAGGVRLHVRLSPRASRNAVGAVIQDSDGNAALKLTVNAPPADGKANAAMVALLADVLDVPKSAISIASGASSRRKTLMIAGDGAEIGRRLDSCVRSAPAL